MVIIGIMVIGAIPAIKASKIYPLVAINSNNLISKEKIKKSRRKSKLNNKLRVNHIMPIKNIKGNEITVIKNEKMPKGIVSTVMDLKVGDEMKIDSNYFYKEERLTDKEYMEGTKSKIEENLKDSYSKNQLITLKVAGVIDDASGACDIMLFTVLTGMGYNNNVTLLVYSLILAINHPVEMLFTSLNVVGDAATCIVVSKSEGLLDEEVYNS